MRTLTIITAGSHSSPRSGAPLRQLTIPKDQCASSCPLLRAGRSMSSPGSSRRSCQSDPAASSMWRMLRGRAATLVHAPRSALPPMAKRYLSQPRPIWSFARSSEPILLMIRSQASPRSPWWRLRRQ